MIDSRDVSKLVSSCRENERKRSVEVEELNRVAVLVEKEAPGRALRTVRRRSPSR